MISSNCKSAPFNVVYFDGDSYTNIGAVTVEHFRSFNMLLSLLSRRTGISPHDFSVFLAEIGTHRKIPLNPNVVKLLAVSRNVGASNYLYVTRSKKNSPTKRKTKPPERVMFLCRDGADGTPTFPGFRPPIMDFAEPEREAFLKSERIDGAGDGGAMCEECLVAKRKGIDADFHLCVHDEVVVGWFRTTAGPISRPVRNSGGCVVHLFGLKQCSTDPLREFADKLVAEINTNNMEDITCICNIYVDLDFQVSEAKLIWVLQYAMHPWRSFVIFQEHDDNVHWVCIP